MYEYTPRHMYKYTLTRIVYFRILLYFFLILLYVLSELKISQTFVKNISFNSIAHDPKHNHKKKPYEKQERIRQH